MVDKQHLNHLKKVKRANAEMISIVLDAFNDGFQRGVKFARRDVDTELKHARRDVEAKALREGDTVQIRTTKADKNGVRQVKFYRL